MTRARVTQFAGVPGGGKTYQLRQRLEAEKADGLGLHEFYWLNFTNSGREDVEPELEEVFADADPEADPPSRAKTVHGLALSLAIEDGAIDPDAVEAQIIIQGGDGGPFAEFCDREGLSYEPGYSSARRLLESDRGRVPTGNVLFAINDYLTQTCKGPEQWRDSRIAIRIPGDAVERLLRRWDRFKREHDPRLFEHGDYVALAADRGLTPDAKVLLIDEFQDLAPLEYRLFKIWRDNGPVAWIYIAGDANQAIYSFRGGTPYYFERTDVDERVRLNETRRCPQQIARLGRAVLEAHPETDPEGFTGREEGGTVRWGATTEAYALRDAVIDAAERHVDATPSVMLLVRTNYHLRQLTRDLRAIGIPYEMLGASGGIWQGKLGRMLAFLKNWDAEGQASDYKSVRTVIGDLPGDWRYDQLPRRPHSGILDREDIEAALEGFENATAIAEHLRIEPWKRDSLANAIEAPAYLNPSEVRVGTIHTAKGLEAPAVFLFTDSSQKTARRYSRDDRAAAEEHRVYYVGMTRASSELNLIDGFFNGPTAPPIAAIRRRVAPA